MSTNLSHVRLGTSSWAYEGWQGLLYQRTRPKSRFSQDTLTEYAGYWMDGIALFRTVGIDHSFCRPASPDSSSYGNTISAQQNFRWPARLGQEPTIPAECSKGPSSSFVKGETQNVNRPEESGNERRFTRYVSRVSRTPLADFSHTLEGSLTPSFHFVSLKPRRDAAIEKTRRVRQHPWRSNPERSFDG